MATSIDFGEYYKSISNEELLRILENQKDYQPSAIEAAKQEFTNRALTNDEIQTAKEPLIAEQAKVEKRKEKVRLVEDNIKNKGYTIVEAINPIQKDIQTVDRTIRMIVILFGVLSIYQFINEIGRIKGYLTDITRFPLDTALILLPFITLPIATFTFWKRKQMGWVLLVIFSTFSIVGAAWLLFHSFFWRPSGFEGLDSLFPRPSPLTYIVQLIFFVAILFVVCKQNMKDVYSISNNKMQATIAITALTSLLLIMASS